MIRWQLYKYRSYELTWNTWCTLAAESQESFCGRHSFQFCQHICIYLVSGASYSRLNNASWEVTKDSSGLAQPFWPNQHQPYQLSLSCVCKCCCVTMIWFETEAVLWHQCMQRSPSQWEVSMHKQPLLSFAACLLSSAFSPYTATLPYIVKSSVLLQK